MAKTNVTGTIEWADWDRLEPISPIPVAKAPFMPFLAEVGEKLPPPPGHDHAVNDVARGPAPESNVSLIISGQVNTQLPHPNDEDTGPPASLLPVHTPEWTDPDPGHPGRTSEELNAGEAGAMKVSLTVPGHICTSPVYFDDEDFDLGEINDFSGSPAQQPDPGTQADPGRLAGHGILVDFEDDTFTLGELLDQFAQPETDQDDPGGTPDGVETPTAPEPPVPHAMAQFILIVGMADAPSEDPGADDGAIAAAVV